MSSFRDIVSYLERRDRRVRGVATGVWVALAGAGLGLILASVSASSISLPAWLVWLPFMLGVASAAALFALAARSPRLTSLVLFEVDVRLGLEARLSSLLAMEQLGSPKAFAERVFQDVQRLAPDWRRGLPIPRRTFVAGGAVALTLALTLTVPLFLPLALSPTASTPSAEAALASSPVTHASALGEEERAEEEPRAPLVAAGSPSPTAVGPAKSQRTLSEILSDLRPALASASRAASEAADPLKSETSASELRSELARLQQRLEEGNAALSDEDVRTLRTAAASSPDLTAAIDEGVAASDLDALRRTISQLLSASTPQAGVVTDTTRSELRPSDETAGEGAPAPIAAPPSSAPTAGTPSSGAPGTSDGGQGSPPLEQEPAPIFESGVGDVAPVSAPIVVGAAGAASSYITSGVPVEAAPGATTEAPTWELSPSQVRSVLSGRNLPAGAAETVRDYFQRITEETP